MSNLILVICVFTLLRYGFGVSLAKVNGDLLSLLFLAALILDFFRILGFRASREED